MSAYNIVSQISAACPACGVVSVVGVQFKFGSTRQLQYELGDEILWGGNDIGSPGKALVVVDGAADSNCPLCGYSGDWDFYVYVEANRIVRVDEATGVYCFRGSSFLELPNPGGLRTQE